MGDIKFVTALVLITVFAIAVISYVVNFADDNEVVVDLGNDSEFTTLSSSLNTQSSSFKTDVQSSSDSFANSTIDSGDETTKTGGQFKVGMWALTTGVFSIFTIIFQKIFGGDVGFGVILTAFSSILIYMGIRYIWKTWKGGNPD